MDTYKIYGLRLKGEHEVRYVGLTRKPLRDRQRQHIYRAAETRSGTQFGRWLISNRDRVEAFRVATCDSRELAKATEKAVITVCQGLGQRLFNVANAGVGA